MSARTLIYCVLYLYVQRCILCHIVQQMSLSYHPELAVRYYFPLAKEVIVRLRMSSVLSCFVLDLTGLNFEIAFSFIQKEPKHEGREGIANETNPATKAATVCGPKNLHDPYSLFSALSWVRTPKLWPPTPLKLSKLITLACRQVYLQYITIFSKNSYKIL